MRILGVDYGRKKIGLAIAEGSLAEPYKVIKAASLKEAVEKVSKEAEVLKVAKVIVGISENKIGEETEEFVSALRTSLSVPIETFDETLTTQEAQRRAIEAGIKRAKRKELEDAYAATLMLQNYLDSHIP